MRKVAYYLVQTFLYYVAWALGILLVTEGRGWESFSVVFLFASLQYALEYRFCEQRKALLSMVVLLTFLGVAVDTVWVVSGIADFAANPFAGYVAPPWMMALWLSFAVFTYATKPYLYLKPYVLAVFALIGFSLVYAIGAKLHVVEFPYGTVFSCAVIGLVWCCFLPVYIKFWRKLYGS